MKNVKEIQATLRSKASTKYRANMQRFAIDNRKAYGVPTPEIRKVARAIRKSYKGEPKKLFFLLTYLWRTKNYESKKLVTFLLPFCEVKNVLKVLTRFLSESGDWSICDSLCGDTVAVIMKRNPTAIEKLFSKWIHSKNLWVRRAVPASIAYYSISNNGNKYRIYIKALKSDKEYYVKKAVQWAEREMGS